MKEHAANDHHRRVEPSDDLRAWTHVGVPSHQMSGPDINMQAVFGRPSSAIGWNRNLGDIVHFVLLLDDVLNL